MIKKRLLIVIIVIAISISFFVYKKLLIKQKAPYIFVSGNIETTEVKVSFKIPGRVSKILVNEGDNIKKGDLIAKLEDKELIDQINKAFANLEALKSKIQSLLTLIEKEVKISDDEIAQAEADLKAANARLSLLMSGTRPQEIEQAKATVEETKAELDKFKKYMERANELYRGGYIAAKDWDAAKANYEAALARNKKANELYQLLKEGPRKEEIEEAQSKVEKAKAILSLAHSKKLQVKVYQKELEILRAQIKEANASVEVSKRQLEYSEIYSPISGVVLVKSVEEGEYVSPGATVVTVADIENVWLTAYIDETDLGRIKLGQKVKIKTDTFPDKNYEGKISFISSEAEFTPKQVQTKKERVKLVYRIKIQIKNQNRELKPGMPADGEILIEG